MQDNGFGSLIESLNTFLRASIGRRVTEQGLLGGLYGLSGNCYREYLRLGGNNLAVAVARISSKNQEPRRVFINFEVYPQNYCGGLKDFPPYFAAHARLAVKCEGMGTVYYAYAALSEHVCSLRANLVLDADKLSPLGFEVWIDVE